MNKSIDSEVKLLTQFSALLEDVAHRPYPLSAKPWIMTQTWSDLLFAHWRVSARKMRDLVPQRLELDTYDGDAWIGVVPFNMTNVGLRHLPLIPGASSSLELNVRTYVRCQGTPGVYFFSLDAENPLFVWSARLTYYLPYYMAVMSQKKSSGCYEYASERRHPASPLASFKARYKPIADAAVSAPGSIEHFLTERYCLFAVSGKSLYRGEVHHKPWPLQRAEAEIEMNTMCAPLGLQIEDSHGLFHFAARLDTLEWPLQKT
ncbi:MAG TPA: DUF2071 domain-containing protein [Candidatus Obscuribacterales bacterium]